MWDEDELILLDFDATGRSNPTCCLCESAFTFSRMNNQIRYDFYETYLQEYLKDYGKVEDDFNTCLYVCLNGKLQWLSYMLSKNGKKEDNYISETIAMVGELMLYANNIKNFNDIYQKVKHAEN